MFFVLLVFTLYVIAICAVKGIKGINLFSKKDTPKSDLEAYIMSKNPQSVSEVDRHTIDYYSLRAL